MPLCKNVYILVSFRPAGSEGFEVRSHFNHLCVSQINKAKDCLHCYVYFISHQHFMMLLAPPELESYICYKLLFSRAKAILILNGIEKFSFGKC